MIRGQQGGKLYNKWRAYGQVKTANVLMGVALAERLGGRGLTAVSLHPGVIGSTHLSDHLGWKTEYGNTRGYTFRQYPFSTWLTTGYVPSEAVDQELGNKEGFATGFDYKTPERGV